MRVTIITPTFNSEKYLNACIQSVIEQDYHDIEHIVVDGLSTDSTMEIVRSHKNHLAASISEKDRGMYDAINKGMAIATGDIIGILNSDDVLASNDVISTIVQTFQQNPVDTIYGDLQYVDPDDINKIYRTWKGKPFKRSRFKYGWMPAHPTFYIKRSLVNQYGGYENHFYSAADYEFMSRYLFVHKVSSYYLPKLLVKMRRGGQSNSNLKQRLRANRRDYLAMKKNKIPLPFLVAILKPLSKLPQYYKKKG
ncbi:MAG TPA: glycosyltransferase family 2 protein [Ferruginibacter sp.]|mgnify:CR=1 FL=1|nr:glycosyltransferase family 2 protein [Ferruginibacter sp.]HRO16561.1 glycosyltransferase family 2 protein [Ferruginibacter sp.]HRQ19930.1 glycosyltransferase family 2 protein [Ferruginibacter sp.]